MFETAELGRKVPKADYKKQVPLLREELLVIQQDLRKADFPVILVFAGVDGAGKGEIVNLLSEWMDPRWLVTHAYTKPSQEEAERPEYWRYWRDLPPKGRIGIFLSSWYSTPVLDRVNNHISIPEFDEKLDRIIAFEKALADDGALILKFWMHLGKSEQKKRLNSLEKDPEKKWRVTETDWHHWRLYNDFVAGAEQAIMRTSTGAAPWDIIEGGDLRYSSLAVAKAVLKSVQKHLQKRKKVKEVVAQMKAAVGPGQMTAGEEAEPTEDYWNKPVPRPGMPTIISTLKMDQILSKEDYLSKLNRYQAKLNYLHRESWKHKVSSLIVLEGWDAGGKGGAVRRSIAALDARRYQVIPFAAPTDEERAHHYLWRFWRHQGRAGRVTFFDRSWYGRVLVERVEGFARDDEWMRAFAEINDFEAQLVEHGIVLCKFWLNITPEEQLERFKSRQEIAYKRWKLTEEDWRNRDRWADYEIAVNDMVERTSTTRAPWTLVEGNDKRFARIKVLKTLCERMEKALKTLKKK